MGYKAAVQVLKQAEDLKPKILKKCDLLTDSEAWANQQKLQSIYHQVLVLDLEYALDKKVEQDLWNIGFKNHITNLQEKSRDKKDPHRSDYQALLTWALESASGFYLTLLQELCNAFDIDLPFRRRGNVYGQSTTCNEQINVPQIASCSYICQYCLVHLGDIARYRNQRRQAENFYKQAILVSPHSGHPYNQLALLEASQGDKLSTVFYYIRGICVKNPFPASTTNLMSVLSSAIDKDSPSEKIQTKMTVNEYIQLFLCAHGHFHTATDVKQAELAVKSLNSVMTALVATQSFKKQELIKITIINLYALKHLGKHEDLTKEELKIKDLVLELIAGSLSAFLMPVYTVQTDEGLLEYYALPAAKFLMYYITNHPELLKGRVFKERMQIWPSLCKLVNAAQGLLIGFNYNKFSRCSLQEDRNLQGFLPLQQNLKDFSFKDEIEDVEVESKVRMRRIIDFGIWLCGYDLDGTKLITKTETKGLINFEPVLSQPDPTNELLEEMKSFTIKESKENKYNNFPEKKAGILKPQGSLEKSREEREVKKNTDIIVTDSVQKISDTIRNKRSKQNVALQSIFKKMEESKQVKFNVEDSQDKDKSVKFEQPQTATTKIPQQPPLLPPSQGNQFSTPPPPLRTQSFNQNHPAFPLQSNPQNPPNQPATDYLTSLRNLGKGADNMMPQFSKNSPFSNLPPNGVVNSSQQSQQGLKMLSYPPPFNVPPPQFNAWGREDLKLASTGGQNTWWGQNAPPQNPGFTQNNQGYPPQTPSPYTQQRQESKPQNIQNYPGPNQAYPSQNQSYPSQRPQDNPGFGGMNYPAFGLQYQNQLVKPLQNSIQNMGGSGQYDVFGSPWGGVNRGSSFVGDDMSQTSMSMRQAMLKEATFSGGRMGVSQQQGIPQSPEQLLSPQTPGYSLFNNSWAPSLPGQLRNSKMADATPFNGPQHSLFGGHGPQSLAQLLEHQQTQMGVAPGGRNSNTNQDS